MHERFNGESDGNSPEKPKQAGQDKQPGLGVEPSDRRPSQSRAAEFRVRPRLDARRNVMKVVQTGDAQPTETVTRLSQPESQTEAKCEACLGSGRRGFFKCPVCSGRKVVVKIH